MKDKHILVGICGSFCNHAAVLEELKKLAQHNKLTFVISENVNRYSTRFFERDVFIGELNKLTSDPIMSNIVEAERVGPDNIYDIMLIAPLTATVCNKFALGIYDHPVTLGAKAMLRNQKNIVIGMASNDALSISGPNLMKLLLMKHIYSLPFGQDNPFKKETSLVSHWELIEETLDYAMENKQIQPLLLPLEGAL